MNKIIGVDCDDILIKFNATFIEWHNREHNSTMTYERAVSFDMPKLYNEEPELMMARVYAFSQNPGFIDQIEGASESLRQIAQDNTIHLITSRCPSLADVTNRLLNRHSMDCFADKHFLGGFGSIHPPQEKKHEVCKRIGASVLIDDSPSNAFDAAEAGLLVYLLNHPWNTEVSHENIRRVSSWPEIVDGLAHAQAA